MRDADALGRASRARWAPAGVYLATIVLIGLLVWSRSLPPTVVATQDLDRNHPIAASDLQTEDSAKLVGKFLRQSVKKGQSIVEAMVASEKQPPRLASAIAAVVTMPVKTRLERGIEVGREVQICVKGKSFGPRTKVIEVSCDEQVCSVVVSLPKIPDHTIDPEPFADAMLVSGARKCEEAWR